MLVTVLELDEGEGEGFCPIHPTAYRPPISPPIAVRRAAMAVIIPGIVVQKDRLPFCPWVPDTSMPPHSEHWSHALLEPLDNQRLAPMLTCPGQTYRLL